MEEPRVFHGYALLCSKPDTPERWNHLFRLERSTKMCGEGEVAAVEVREDPEGDHYAWWDNEHASFKFLWWNKMSVEICFPYGTKVEEERGRGKLCRVHVSRQNPNADL